MQTIDSPPIIMEEHFLPGFKASSLLLLGSQTNEIWKDVPKLQAPEDFYLAGLKENNVAVVRNMDPNYINYFSSLIKNGRVINLFGVDKGAYLSTVILQNSWALEQIKNTINNDFRLLPFLITPLEQEIANKLGIQIYGSQKICNLYGTKSGARTLAHLANIPLSPGFICSTVNEIQTAILALREKFDFVAIKHDASISGFLSLKMSTRTLQDLDKKLATLLNRKFIEKKDIVVVEGWIKNKASIGAHIEILPNKPPIICSAWQQIIDTDGVSYIGAGPLTITPKALQNLKKELGKLATTLKEQGAYGSFGPDFLITSEDEDNFEADSVLLIELNARIPYTAFPLEIIKSTKGTIGSGFFSTHINLKTSSSFIEIAEPLSKAKLLITNKNQKASGVVPFNIGMLPWRSFNIVAMADTLEETQYIVNKVHSIFHTHYS